MHQSGAFFPPLPRAPNAKPNEPFKDNARGGKFNASAIIVCVVQIFLPTFVFDPSPKLNTAKTERLLKLFRRYISLTL